jgi:hypothetical protein
MKNSLTTRTALVFWCAIIVLITLHPKPDKGEDVAVFMFDLLVPNLLCAGVIACTYYNICQQKEP